MRLDGCHSISTRLAPTGPPVCQKRCSVAPGLILSAAFQHWPGQASPKQSQDSQEIEGVDGPVPSQRNLRPNWHHTGRPSAAAAFWKRARTTRPFACCLVPTSHPPRWLTAPPRRRYQSSLGVISDPAPGSDQRASHHPRWGPLRHRRGTLLWGGPKICRDRHPM
jgi:hypothetical protein